MMGKAITAYKLFDENLSCRGFQYEVGKTYKHEGGIEICEAGFHACEFPFDCWSYYPATSRMAEVELSGKTETDGDNTKLVAAEIKIKAELSLPEFLKRGVDYILSKVDWDNAAATNTGDRSAATNTGYRSAATNTGYQSAATNTGDRSAATNTGYQSAATNTGYQSAATNTGYRSAATNTGYQSAATNTGDRSAATNTGYQSAATNTGYQSAATNTGKHGIAIASGFYGSASGSEGSALVLVERLEDWGSADHGKILHVWSGIVGEDDIKPDVFYTLKDGKPIEVSAWAP